MGKSFLNLALFILLGCSCNRNKENLMLQVSKDQSTEYIDDKKFVNDAHDAIMMNVHLGRLAKKNASSEMVKQLAIAIMDDCCLSHFELRRLSTDKKIKLKDELSESKQAQYNAFSKVSGKAFDIAFMKYILKDYINDIAVFEDEVVKGRDPEIRSWAEGEAGITKHHLQMAQLAMDNMETR